MLTNKNFGSQSAIIYLFGGLSAAKMTVQAVDSETLVQLIQNSEKWISFNVLAGGFMISMFISILMQA
jgi:hypothetical protein